jgi:hypothetical protein
VLLVAVPPRSAFSGFVPDSGTFNERNDEVKNLNKALVRKKPQLIPLADAKDAWATWRVEHGRAPKAPLLTQPDGNTKLAKAEAATYGLTLSPAGESGVWNTCSWSTALCRKGCLKTSGRMPMGVDARTLKTTFLGAHPDAFVTLVHDEISRAAGKHDAVRIRLNVLSDIEWERVAPFLFDVPSNVLFYDYTKARDRWAFDERPDNYRLVFSASEKTKDADLRHLLMVGNVSMVFDRIPDEYLGIRVWNGDKSDDRWAEPIGSLVGLKGKGKMRDTEAFIPFIRRAA